MRTVLLAWELGSGFGHVINLRRLAARLSRHRLRLVAAVQDVGSARILASEGVEVLPAPPWPCAPVNGAQSAPGSSASLTDMLAGLGLADEAALRSLLGAWDCLLRLLGPDLVVADFAPAAALAARRRVPLVWVGNGYTLPPDGMERFPLLHYLSAPVWRESEILSIVNQAGKATGCAPLERLPQLFAADARAVQTFAVLDPYHCHRDEPLDGPILDRVPAARKQDARLIFVYLRGHFNLGPGVVAALTPFAGRLRIFGPGLDAAHAAALARAGARLEKDPPPLAAALSAARLFVHLGGTGAANEAIATGVPQLVLGVDIEKAINGQALEHAGIGRVIRVNDPATKIPAEIVDFMMRDDRIASRAAEVGEGHRALLRRSDPLSRFEHKCLELLAA